jgi:DNA repair exonuclease SbcCD ATPase subunit
MSNPSPKQPTAKQLIDELKRELDKLTAAAEKQRDLNDFAHGAFDSQLKEAKERVEKIEERVRVGELKLTDLEGRVKALEKGTDRNWQVWLALIGAGLALIVAFLKK